MSQQLIPRISDWLSKVIFTKTRTTTVRRSHVAIGLSALGALWLGLRFYRRRRALPIEGSVAVISGGSQGIGLAIAKKLAASGAKRVILLARGKAALDEAVAAINASYPNVAVAVPVDCSNPQAVRAATSSIIKTHGPIDFLINNAGTGRWRALFEMDDKEVATCLSAPFLSSVNLCQSFLPSMVSRDHGQIVNIQSPASLTPIPGSTMYSTARFALRGLTEALRSDLYSSSLLVQEIVLSETKSNYFENNPGSHERIPGIGAIIPTLTVDQAAVAVVSGMRSGKKVVTYPAMLRLMSILIRYDPQGNGWLTSWLVTVTGWKIDDAVREKARLACPSLD